MNDYDDDDNDIKRKNQPIAKGNTICCNNNNDDYEERIRFRSIYDQMQNIPYIQGNCNEKLLTQSVMVTTINEWQIQQEQIEIMDFVDGMISSSSSSSSPDQQQNVPNENINDDDHHQRQDLDHEKLVNIKQTARKLRRLSYEFNQRQQQKSLTQRSSMIMMNEIINLVRQTIIDICTYTFEIMTEKYYNFFKNIFHNFLGYR